MAITEWQWKQLSFNRRLNDGSDPPSTNNGLPTKAFASQTSVVSFVIFATLQHNLELSLFLLNQLLSSSSSNSVLPCALLPTSWLPFPRPTCIILWIIPSVSSHMSVLFVPNPMKVRALKHQLWAEHFLGNPPSLSFFSANPLLSGHPTTTSSVTSRGITIILSVSCCQTTCAVSLACCLSQETHFCNS